MTGPEEEEEEEEVEEEREEEEEEDEDDDDAFPVGRGQTVQSLNKTSSNTTHNSKANMCPCHTELRINCPQNFVA